MAEELNVIENSPTVEDEKTILNQDTEQEDTSSKMTIAECQVETQKHIENVRRYIRFMIDKF